MAPGQGRRRSKLASPPAPPPRTPHACAVLDACGPHACRQPFPSRCHAASRRTRPGCCCCSTWTKTRCGGGWVGWGVSGWGAHAACAAGGQCPRRPGPSASGVPCLGWLIRCKASTLPACSHKPLPVRRVPCRLPSLAPPHETVASHATSIKTAGGHPLPLLSPNIKPALFPAVCGADSHGRPGFGARWARNTRSAHYLHGGCLAEGCPHIRPAPHLAPAPLPRALVSSPTLCGSATRSHGGRTSRGSSGRRAGCAQPRPQPPRPGCCSPPRRAGRRLAPTAVHRREVRGGAC